MRMTYSHPLGHGLSSPQLKAKPTNTDTSLKPGKEGSYFRVTGEIWGDIWETTAPALPATHLPIPPGTEKPRAEDGGGVMGQAEELSKQPLSDIKDSPATPVPGFGLHPQNCKILWGVGGGGLPVPPFIVPYNTPNITATK